MGFLDKAKAAANDLAAKADTAMANAGLGGPGGASPERYFRDLGGIAYLEATGRTAPPEEKQRITAALTERRHRVVRAPDRRAAAGQRAAAPGCGCCGSAAPAGRHRTAAPGPAARTGR